MTLLQSAKWHFALAEIYAEYGEDFAADVHQQLGWLQLFMLEVGP